MTEQEPTTVEIVQNAERARAIEIVEWCILGGGDLQDARRFLMLQTSINEIKLLLLERRGTTNDVAEAQHDTIVAGALPVCARRQ